MSSVNVQVRPLGKQAVCHMCPLHNMCPASAQEASLLLGLAATVGRVLVKETEKMNVMKVEAATKLCRLRRLVAE
jgi:hypothetical protein